MPGDFANRDEALLFLRRFVDQGAGPSANLTNSVLQAMALLLLERFEAPTGPVLVEVDGRKLWREPNR